MTAPWEKDWNAPSPTAPWETDFGGGPTSVAAKAEAKFNLAKTTDEPVKVGEELTQLISEGRDEFENTTAGFNQAIANNPVSLMVDAANWALDKAGLGSETPVGGTESMTGLFESFGASTSPDPDAFSGKFGSEMGYAVTGAGAAGGLVKTGLPIMQKYAAPIVDYYMKNPWHALMFDTHISGLQVAGGEAGEESGADIGKAFGNEEAGRQLGEFAGRVGAPLAANATMGLGRKIAHAADDFIPVSEASKTRAAKKQLREYQTKPHSDHPEPEFGKPSTGELMDEPGLIGARRGMARRSPEAVGKSQDVSTIQNQSLRKGLAKLDAEGESNVAFFKKKVDDSIKATEDMVAKVIDDARFQVSKVDVDADVDTISSTASKRLDDSLQVARARESSAWEDIGVDRYWTKPVKDRAGKIIDSIGKFDNPQDVHPIIYQVAGRDLPPHVIDEYGLKVGESEAYAHFMQNGEPIKDILKLRGRLLEVSRKERANGNWNRARHARGLAKSMTDDIKPLNAGPEALVKAEEARRLSSKFHETFTEGPLGKVMGYTSKGDVKVAPEAILEKLIPTGTKGKLGARALEKSAQYSEDPDAISKGIKDYLSKKFVADVVDIDTGKVNPAKAKAFLKNNPVLDDYPELRTTLDNARQSQMLADSVDKAAVKRIKHIEDVSIASRYTKGEPAIQMDAVLNSKTPLKDMKVLVKLVKNDARAMNGLKHSFYQTMMGRVAPDARQLVDAAGDTTVNAKNLRKFLVEYRPVVKELYGDEGLKLLKSVSHGANINARIAKGIAAGGGSDTSQNLSMIQKIGTIAGVIGTKLSGGVHELLAFGIFKRAGMKMAHGLSDPKLMSVNEIVEEALYDPKLYKLIMSKPTDVNVERFFNNTIVRNILLDGTPPAEEQQAQTQ